MVTTPVPPIPDTDRYAVYYPVSATTDFALGFPLFGDATDIVVFLNGSPLTLGSDYSVLSLTSGATLTPIPISDAFIRLSVAISSGKLEVYGARRPRRTLQATAPYSTRDFNVVMSDLWATMRELYSKFSRAIQVPVGENPLSIPDKVTRANSVLAFDGLGNPVAVAPYTGGAVGTVNIVDGTITFPKIATAALGTASVDALVGAGTAKLLSAAQTADAVSIVGRSVYNVKAYGAKGDGATNDTSAIQAAINAAQAAGGGIVYFPSTSGYYKTTAALAITASNVSLWGDGRSSTIGGVGSFHTITFTGAWGAALYGNSIVGIRLAEYNKTGGYSVYSSNVAQHLWEDLFVDNSYAGCRLHNFNDVNLHRIRLANIQQVGGQTLILTGGGTADAGRSDVISFSDCIVSGQATTTGTPTGNYHGIIVDGFVSTLSSHKLYITAVDGNGLWFRNTIGATQAPQFASFYGLEADYCGAKAIFLQAGNRFYFSDPQIHGSYGNSNIYIANGVNTVKFSGGFSSGAGLGGIDIDGQFVIVENMMFLSNSSPSRGGTAGAWAGIALDIHSAVTIVRGCISGDSSNPTWQSYGILIVSAAVNFIVEGNILLYNVGSGVSNDAGTGATKIVANNV